MRGDQIHEQHAAQQPAARPDRNSPILSLGAPIDEKALEVLGLRDVQAQFDLRERANEHKDHGGNKACHSKSQGGDKADAVFQEQLVQWSSGRPDNTSPRRFFLKRNHRSRETFDDELRGPGRAENSNGNVRDN